VVNIGSCNGPTPHRIGIAAVLQFLCVSRYTEQVRERESSRENTSVMILYDAFSRDTCMWQKALQQACSSWTSLLCAGSTTHSVTKHERMQNLDTFRISVSRDNLRNTLRILPFLPLRSPRFFFAFHLRFSSSSNASRPSFLRRKRACELC